MTPLSEIVITQIKSNEELAKALVIGGWELSLVKQQRARRAEAIRSHFQVLKGGLG